ncbi:MAG: hypothetical protein ABEI86_04710 [Halobacteriaceae archaeon]
MIPQPSGAPTLRVLIGVTFDELPSSYLPDTHRKENMESGEANEPGNKLQNRMDAIEILQNDAEIVGDAIKTLELSGDPLQQVDKLSTDSINA